MKGLALQLLNTLVGRYDIGFDTAFELASTQLINPNLGIRISADDVFKSLSIKNKKIPEMIAFANQLRHGPATPSTQIAALKLFEYLLPNNIHLQNEAFDVFYRAAESQNPDVARQAEDQSDIFCSEGIDLKLILRLAEKFGNCLTLNSVHASSKLFNCIIPKGVGLEAAKIFAERALASSDFSIQRYGLELLGTLAIHHAVPVKQVFEQCMAASASQNNQLQYASKKALEKLVDGNVLTPEMLDETIKKVALPENASPDLLFLTGLVSHGVGITAAIQTVQNLHYYGGSYGEAQQISNLMKAISSNKEADPVQVFSMASRFQEEHYLLKQTSVDIMKQLLQNAPAESALVLAIQALQTKLPEIQQGGTDLLSNLVDKKVNLLEIAGAILQLKMSSLQYNEQDKLAMLMAKIASEGIALNQALKFAQDWLTSRSPYSEQLLDMLEILAKKDFELPALLLVVQDLDPGFWNPPETHWKAKALIKQIIRQIAAQEPKQFKWLPTWMQDVFLKFQLLF